MPKGILFWVVYVIAFIFAGWASWPADGRNFRPGLPTILAFILIGLLGWGVYGFIIQ